MTTEHANTPVAAAQSQNSLPATSSPRRLSYETFVQSNQTASRRRRRQSLPVDTAKLEATYSGHICELPECQARVRSYSYASLYPKGSHSARSFQKKTGCNGLKATGIHHTMWVGRRWIEILNLFDSIVTELCKRSPNFKPCGLLFLLKFGYHWYRAKDDVRRLALTNLCVKTDLVERASFLGGLVAEQVDEMKKSLSFIQPEHDELVSRPSLYSSDDREIVPKAFSSSVLPREISEDGKVVLILVCMLSSSPFSTRLLLSGATPRKRWTEQGHVREAHCDGLSSALQTVLSNELRLQRTIDELENASAFTKTSDGNYTVDAATKRRTLRALLPEDIRFWSCQAFLVVCHAVPWKYLEILSSEQRELLMPHLEHTLQDCRIHKGFSAMSSSVKRGVALMLLEASRFTAKRWKLLAVACAQEITQGIDDPYIKICIAQRESLLYRLSGSQQDAIDVLDNLLREPKQRQHSGEMESRMHAAVGHSAVQRAMNFFQDEKLAAAINALDSWQPLHRTAAEEAVGFRMSILRARILRFQGRFKESLACLERHMHNSFEGLLFNEDLPDLVCELADTLRELDQPLRAEELLQNELTRGSHEHRASTKNLLKLCLAESLYAQGRFSESYEVCYDVQCQPGLVKMGKLRLLITLAKLRHIHGEWEAAFDHWTQALLVLNSFPPTSGLAARTIYLSTCDILRRQGRGELELAARANVMTLEKLCEDSEAKHWIAGLSQWLAFLNTRST